MAWPDTFQKLARAFKKGVRPFDVTFIRENAKDRGGLKREFFTVIFEDVKKYLLCAGAGDGYTFKHDIERLKRHEFVIFGNLLGLAILYGCAGLRYLMAAVVSKMFFRKAKCRLFIHDIPDLEIQQKLIKIDIAKSETDFQNAISDFPERFDAISKPSIKFQEKDSFVQNMIEHFIVSRCSEEIFDVASGLDIFNLNVILSCHLEEIFSEFSLGEKSKPSSEDVIKMFADVDYCQESKEIKTLQGDIFYNLTNYAQEAEDKPFILTVLQIDGEVETTKQRKVTLSDFVKFISGSRFVPSMIGKCRIKFKMPKDCDSSEHISVSTCQLLIEIPLNKRYCVNTEQFNKAMSEDICESPGFGNQ
ncbi:uncharacterized protein [Clytia hemisphaerica]|uniref:uncharacterized protein n=1 Tax=Clytia hemisphaerica TaxID=252671 RepID=UPI0034D5C1C2